MSHANKLIFSLGMMLMLFLSIPMSLAYHDNDQTNLSNAGVESTQTPDPFTPTAGPNAVEIVNYSFGFGCDCDDGLLRLDYTLNIQWVVEGATDIRIDIYQDTGGNNPPTFIRQIPLATSNGSVEYLVSDLVSEAGSYYFILVASNQVDATSQTYQTDIYPALGLPDYVEQEWVDAASAVEVCYVAGGSGAPIRWQLTNNNSVILETHPHVRVLFDWSLRNVVGEILQSAQRRTNPGVTPLNTRDGYIIGVNTYLDINHGEHTYPIGESAALATEFFACEN